MTSKMGKVGALSLVGLVAAACGKHPTPPLAPPIAPLPAAAPAAPAQLPRCGPPTQAAAVEVTDIAEARVVIVEIPGGRVLWRAREGSGESGPPRWSNDGARLAYVVGGELLVHEGGRPDRVVMDDLEEDLGEPGFRFSPDGDRLAAITTTGIAVVDLAAAAIPTRHDFAIDCVLDQFLWSPTGRSLVGLCADAESNLVDIDLATGRTRSQPMEKVTRLLGWRGAPAALVVAEESAVVALDRERTERLRSDAGEGLMELVQYVAGADRFLYAGADYDSGYPEVVWLGEVGDGVPQPWLRTNGVDFGFTGDGAWALFTAVDEASGEAWGDLYLVETGRRKVTRVVEAPHSGHGDADLDDDDEEGEVGKDASEDEDDSPLVYGYKQPRPRPQVRDCRVKIPRARMRLVEDNRLLDSDYEVEILEGGVVLGVDGGGETAIYTGTERIPIDPARMGELDVGVILDNDNIALLGHAANQSTLWVLGPTGRELWQRPADDVEQLFRTPEGGVAAFGGSLLLYGADGQLLGEVQSASEIELIEPQIDGTIMLVDETGEARFVDRRGAVRRKLVVADLPLNPVVLSDGTLVTSFETEDTDEESYAYGLRFVGRDGKPKGRYLLDDDTELVMTPRALPSGQLLLSLAGDASSLVLVDSRGREVGRTVIGNFDSGSEAVWFDDGSLAVVDGESTIYLLSPTGAFLGGRILDSPINMGPVRIGRDQLAVALDDGVVFLRRQPR